MIRLSKSILAKKDVEAISHVIIEDGYLGMGRFVQRFEKELRNYLRAKYVITVNSGTAALHVALMAVGLKSEEEVLIQSLTYIGSFQAISATGAKPVPCEVLPETCTIDLEDAEKRITEKTKIIMPVHYASRVGDIEDVYEFAKRYNLRVVEDAAHAFGTIYKDKRIGSFGDVICFSFDGIKNITSGEGGAVVTNDEKVAKFVRDARLLAVQKDTEKRYKGERSWEFDVTHQGYRYHLSNLFAALGLSQLERFEKEFKPKRQYLAQRYHEAFSEVKNILLFPNNYDKIVPHIFPIRVKSTKRNGLREHLLSNNIECGIHYYPNHLLSYYGARRGGLPVTEHIYSELLSLPLHPDLTEEEQDKVVKEVKNFLVC